MKTELLLSSIVLYSKKKPILTEILKTISPKPNGTEHPVKIHISLLLSRAVLDCPKFLS